MCSGESQDLVEVRHLTRACCFREGIKLFMRTITWSVLGRPQQGPSTGKWLSHSVFHCCFVWHIALSPKSDGSERQPEIHW